MNTRLIRNLLAHSAGLIAIGSIAHDARAGGTCTPQAFSKTLSPAGLSANSEYGTSVSMSGLTAVVGAPGHVGNRGAVVIHRFVNGTFDDGTIVQPPLLNLGDRFGESVVLTGGLLYVGAPGDDTAELDAGAVYVYEEKFVNNAWTYVYVNELHAIQAKAFDRTGSSISAKGYYLAAGAPKSTVTATEQGRVYVFNAINQNWSNYSVQNLVAPTPQVFEHFGSAVSTDGNSLLIGAPEYDTASPSAGNSGRAFMFTRSAQTGVWSLAMNILPNESLTEQRFGTSVAVDGSIAVVGIPGMKTQFGQKNGGAQTYTQIFGTWYTTNKIESLFSAYGFDNKVGLGVAIDSNRVFLSSDQFIYQFEYQPAINAYGDEKFVIEAPFAEFYSPSLEATGHSIAVSSLFIMSGRPKKFAGDIGRAFTYWRCGGMLQTIGGGSPGSLGIPDLGFAGPMVGGFGCELRLRKGKPGAVSMLAIHAGLPTAIPFHSGLLYAFPIHLMLPIPVDALGEFKIPAVTPSGVQNIEFVLQALIPDPAGKGGVTLSNAVDMVTAP